MFEINEKIWRMLSDDGFSQKQENKRKVFRHSHKHLLSILEIGDTTLPFFIEVNSKLH